MYKTVSIVGAGLAGCEAALQLAKKGFRVTLYDAKPKVLLSTYSFPSFAELVCNNSLAPNSSDTALGLLVSELKVMGSELIAAAELCRIDDDKYFAVDKKKFSKTISQKLMESGVTIINETITTMPEDEIVILASGPLTNEVLIKDVSKKYGVNGYHFADASSVIVDITSVDLNNSNISRITDDLFAVNIPQEVFSVFCRMLKDFSAHSTSHGSKEIEFEKCLSLERLAVKGDAVLSETRFHHPYQEGNCLLLRRENGLEKGYIMVGCMTTLCYSDQRSAFSILPGFNKVKILKYGRMHRNTFFNSPEILDCFYKVRNDNLYIIGQLSGTDGYAPAIAGGLVAALRIIKGEGIRPFPRETMIGGLAYYISNKEVIDYQPMCASFSLLKGSKTLDYYENSMKALKEYKKTL